MTPGRGAALARAIRVAALVAAIGAGPAAAAPAGGAPPDTGDMIVVGGALRAAPRVFGPDETARCLECHGLPSFLARDSLTGTVRRLTVDPRAFRRSVHGSIACTACHPDVRRFPHAFAGRRPRVGCGDDCHARDARGLPVRHDAVVREYARDVHHEGVGGGRPDLPDCADCHGAGDPHAVPPAEAMLPASRMALCAGCHADRERMETSGVTPDAVRSYRASFHYQAVRFGSGRAAVCEDCHTAHHVLAPGDSASSVHPSRLVRTCGKDGCHPGAGRTFALSGTSHLELRGRKDPVVGLAARLFPWLGGLLVLALGVGVLLDLQRRIFGRPAPPPATATPAGVAAPLVQRLSGAQRVQHLALMASFTALALSGLPLRFPDVRAFRALGSALGGLAWMRAIHRGAAVVLVLAGLAHLAYVAALLAAGRRGGRTAWSMLPTRADLRDGWDQWLYDLRLRSEPPTFDRHHFREKIHYFAVLLGVPLMTISGLALWFPVFLGGRLPEGALGVAWLAHGDEGIVAVLVVLVWHLYTVHVLPGPHHRFLAWVDGRVTLGEWRLLHGRAPAPAPATAPVAVPAGAWLVAAIAGTAVLLGVREAIRTPFWFDELFTLWLARHPLPQTMALLGGDVHPPLHSLLVSLWLAVGGDHPLWLKSLPLLVGLGVVLATWRLTRSLFGPGVALLGTALLALHPMQADLAQELRNYGVLTLALLLSAWAAWRWIETGRPRYAAGWSLAGALALYSHYLAALVLALLAVFALAAAGRSRRAVASWLLVHAGMALLVAPLLWIFPGQLRLSHESWLGAPGPANLLDLARKIAFGARYLVPVLGAAALLSLRTRGRRRAALFAWWLAAGTVALTYTLSRHGAHLFSIRYMSLTLPYWCALVAAGLCAIPWRRVAPVAMAAVLLLEARAAMIHQPQAEGVDVTRASRLLAERMRPGDLLFCGDVHSLLDLDYALGGPRGRLLTTERRLPFYRGGAIFPPSRRVPPDTLRAAARAGRRWWAVYFPEAGGFDREIAAVLDSLSPGDRRVIGSVRVWASDPRSLHAGRY